MESLCNLTFGKDIQNQSIMNFKENGKTEFNESETTTLYKSKNGKLHLLNDCFYIKTKKFTEIKLETEERLEKICKECKKTFIQNKFKISNELFAFLLGFASVPINNIKKG